jgi:hypothetical protein
MHVHPRDLVQFRPLKTSKKVFVLGVFDQMEEINFKTCIQTCAFSTYWHGPSNAVDGID